MHILVSVEAILCSLHSFPANHIYSYVIYYLYNLCEGVAGYLSFSFCPWSSLSSPSTKCIV